MNFDIHPSKRLIELFKMKPYQGQSPLASNIIFLSSDANYSLEISNHSFFNLVKEYQQDGISFWKKYGCHHPFLLKEFPFNKTSGGRPFHNTFSRLGLTHEYAENISFLEILDVPTIGNKSQNKDLFYALANKKHLEFIDSLITSDCKKLFFISSGVLKDMYSLRLKHGVFQWLENNPKGLTKFSKLIDSNKIQEIYHFSSSHINKELVEIRSAIDRWLNV